MAISLEARRVYQKKWRKKHKERLKVYFRAWKKSHPEAMKKAQQKYWAKNRNKLLVKRARFRRKHPHYDKDYRRKTRVEVLNHYGKICFCCGEFRYEFLGIDHRKGGGTKHRREIGGGSKIIYWLKRNGFPKGFRVACHNCNMARGLYGYCPHKRRRTQ